VLIAQRRSYLNRRACGPQPGARITHREFRDGLASTPSVGVFGTTGECFGEALPGGIPCGELSGREIAELIMSSRLLQADYGVSRRLTLEVSQSLIVRRRKHATTAAKIPLFLCRGIFTLTAGEAQTKRIAFWPALNPSNGSRDQRKNSYPVVISAPFLDDLAGHKKPRPAWRQDSDQKVLVRV